MARTTISSKGQVTLPEAIREKRRWKAGTRLIVEERSEGILLRSVDRKKKLPAADLQGILKYRGPRHSIEEMNTAQPSSRLARGNPRA